MPRQIAWGIAVAHMRSDRAVRPAVRAEVLRGGLTAWRGLSGRRHLVQVHPFNAEVPGRIGGLAIAVRRDAAGFAHIVAIGGDVSKPSWWARARAAGANELHVHQLARTAGERAAVVIDLTGP